MAQQVGRRLGGCIAGGAGALAALAGLCGCSFDSFLDPSVLGRWEETPAIVPILDNIAAIEDTGGGFVEYSEVTEEDLLPEVERYQVGAGDVLNVTVWDLLVPGEPFSVTRRVDQNGYIEFPQLGRIFLGGLNEQEAEGAIAERVRPLVADPLVSVAVESRRAQSYSLMGAVPSPGLFEIPASDYRLLEALIQAGGVSGASSKNVDIIRQVPLKQAAAGGQREPGAAPVIDLDGDLAPAAGEVQDLPDDDPLRLIDEILGEPGGAPGGGDPGVIGLSEVGLNGFEASARPQPETPERTPVIDLIDDLASEPESPARGPTGEAAPSTRWVFLNGRWVRTAVGSAPRNAEDEAEADDGDPLAAVVTQRVIRVPLEPLLAGDARFNLVVRPGDVVRVQPPDLGNVYLAGQVARPGVYTLPQFGRLTLSRAITAAGGLSGLAIPERCDLTRMVGPDRQATIMLNLRAIAEGTQPDVFLKPDD
ncbi:MAG: polysaccharide biosynthesis/export family protein, partial [Planctomycetota bacterium]